MSKHSATGREWEKLRAAVLKRDNYQCHYCNNEANEADHVIPRSKGGTDTMDNLVASCRRCNGSKGDKMETRVNYVNTHWLSHL